MASCTTPPDLQEQLGRSVHRIGSKDVRIHLAELLADAFGIVDLMA